MTASDRNQSLDFHQPTARGDGIIQIDDHRGFDAPLQKNFVTSIMAYARPPRTNFYLPTDYYNVGYYRDQ